MTSIALSLILVLTASLSFGCGNVDDESRSLDTDDQAIRDTDSAPSLDRIVVIGFWNVENLFDTENDPATDDDDFTPGGRQEWDDERLDAKLDALARGIRSIDSGRGPDIFGLAEVENRAIVERLVEEYFPEGAYEVVHRESSDGRGIDVALLVRPDLFRVVGVDIHPVDLGQSERPTREILEVELVARDDADAVPITILVNHWPSRSGGVEASSWKRERAASVAWDVVEEILAADPAADIVLLGDFNDEPQNRSIAEVLGAGPVDSDRPLRNLATAIAEVDTVGTYLYREDWNVLDQIIVSLALDDPAGLRLLDREMTIHRPDFLRDDHPSVAPMRPPRRTFLRRTLYIGGTSDHFPVVARFLLGSE